MVMDDGSWKMGAGRLKEGDGCWVMGEWFSS